MLSSCFFTFWLFQTVLIRLASSADPIQREANPIPQQVLCVWTNAVACAPVQAVKRHISSILKASRVGGYLTELFCSAISAPLNPLVREMCLLCGWGVSAARMKWAPPPTHSHQPAISSLRFEPLAVPLSCLISPTYFLSYAPVPTQGQKLWDILSSHQLCALRLGGWELVKGKEYKIFLKQENPFGNVS